MADAQSNSLISIMLDSGEEFSDYLNPETAIHIEANKPQSIHIELPNGYNYIVTISEYKVEVNRAE